MPKRFRQLVAQPSDTSYRHIPLTQNRVALVDSSDYEWLNRSNWCAHFNKNSGLWYAERGTAKEGVIAMHRVILDCKGNELADHINGNGLDNRRCNLRKCLKSDNAKNHRRYKNNQSGFTGVAFVCNNCWRAYINSNKVRKHLGCFRTPQEASQAYQEAAKELFGEFNRQ